jgi:acyl-CoA reductase-like NAD-dependent aldehyde dehydrogenase
LFYFIGNVARDIDFMDPKQYNKLFLNGRYVASQGQETYSLKNPKDNTVVIENIPIAGPEDVEAAVKHAENAFHGP